MGQYQDIMDRTEWFRHDRFGMFIHWGLYSVRAKHEWAKSLDRLTDADYQKYFDSFTAEHYDPKAWAKAAKEAGMKYAVLTTKHHEGFCLFDSAYTEYKATNTPAGRDLVREYVDAFRAEGLKVGFYYSLLDWHHPDYPHFGDAHHPQRDDPNEKNDDRNFDNYVTYMHNQVRELMTNYGKIDIVWFDFSYADMTGEKWRATDLVKMIRTLQPGIIIDNRLGGAGPLATFDADEAPIYAGDFFSPEQYVPVGGLHDKLGRPVPWEECLTMQSGSWGYVADNDNFMTAKDIVRTLVDCVSGNGNLLINVGPNGKGEIPKPMLDVLHEVGEWMYENSDSIYGCGGTGSPAPNWGRVTTDGKYVYAHVFDKFGYTASVPDLPADKVDYALYLSDNSEVTTSFWNGGAKDNGGALIAFPKAKLRDPIDTVVKFVLKK